jgi:hypothetical protein
VSRTASPTKPRDDSDACLKALTEFMDSPCIKTVDPQIACKAVDNTTLIQCKSGDMVCPGGMTCGKSLTECSRWTAWEGCPAGTTQCSGNRLSCVTSLEQCQNATGCAVGLQFCGFRRDSTSGQRGATSAPICKASCGDFEPIGNIKPEAKAFNYSRNQPLDKECTDASGSAIMRIKAGKGAINDTQGGSGDLELLVLPVPDSELTDGPFKVCFAKQPCLGTAGLVRREIGCWVLSRTVRPPSPSAFTPAAFSRVLALAFQRAGSPGLQGFAALAAHLHPASRRCKRDGRHLARVPDRRRVCAELDGRVRADPQPVDNRLVQHG